MISTFESPNFLQIYLYLEDDNVADAYLKSANETFFFNLVIWKEQVYCILWERLPAAIVLIRGWKPLPPLSFLATWTYRISEFFNVNFVSSSATLSESSAIVFCCSFIASISIALIFS